MLRSWDCVEAGFMGSVRKGEAKGMEVTMIKSPIRNW